MLKKIEIYSKIMKNVKRGGNMKYKIKEMNLHITEYCTGHCPMCYATDENMNRKHGNIETLKLIIHNAI